jgi:UDP-3-O-[3-hydroxymyristoyl] glucosamine N-acyltransferase
LNHLKNSLTSVGNYDNIGLLDTRIPNTLSFLLDKEFLSLLTDNKNIRGVFVNKNLSSLVPNSVSCHVSEDPMYDFFSLFNTYHESQKNDFESTISASAQIHETAHIANKNVVIKDGVLIGPNAVIHEDVIIGAGSSVGGGTVIGCPNIETRRTSKGLIDVFHNRSVDIGKNVIVGANCTIDKGVYDRDTVVGEGTRIGNNTLVGHGAQIEEFCFILCCTVCGSATVEKGARINPGATIGSKVLVRKNAVVSSGAVVMSTVEIGEKVSGNFAINHNRYLKNFIKTFGLINSKK